MGRKSVANCRLRTSNAVQAERAQVFGRGACTEDAGHMLGAGRGRGPGAWPCTLSKRARNFSHFPFHR